MEKNRDFRPFSLSRRAEPRFTAWLQSASDGRSQGVNFGTLSALEKIPEGRAGVESEVAAEEAVGGEAEFFEGDVESVFEVFIGGAEEEKEKGIEYFFEDVSAGPLDLQQELEMGF